MTIDSGTAEPDHANRAIEPSERRELCRGGADGFDGRIGHESPEIPSRLTPEGKWRRTRRARPEAA